jgi:hypothetical protein
VLEANADSAVSSATGRDAVEVGLIESSTDRPATRVVVEDARARRIPGAAILIREDTDSAQWLQVGAADANGEFSALPAVADSAWIGARARGHVSATVHLSFPVPPVVTLRLVEGGSVCGRVVCRDGSPPRGEVRVVAIRWMHEAEFSVVHRALASGDPTVLAASVSRDGTFCIDGLEPGASYALACGGSGYAQLSPAIRVESGDVGVRIEVARLYAIRLRVGSAEQTPAHDSNLDTAPLTWWCEDERARPEPIGLPTALAAGDPTIVAPSPGTRVRVFSSEDDRDSVGPVHYTCSAPGYLEATGSCFALPIEQGGSHVSLRLEPIASGYGTVELELVYEVSASSGTPGDVFPRGVLELRGPEDVRHRFVVPSSARGHSEIRGIPFGKYRARFEALPSRAWFPSDPESASEITVGEAPVELRITLEGCGALRLRVVDSTGGQYTGGIRASISYWKTGGNPKGVGLGAFTLHRPYTLTGLREGTYSVGVFDPKATGRTSGNATETIVVERGLVATMEWVIDE